MFSRTFRIGAVVALGAALLPLLAGCRAKGNTFKQPPPPKVTVAPPLVKPLTDIFLTTGTTRSVKKVELRSRVAGYLESIEFDDGQVVNKGDLLFVIDKEPYQAALAAAEAELARTKAELKLAEAQLSRVKQLVNQGGATQNKLDVAEAERATATANVAAAKAALHQAKLDLNYTEIRAPIDGIMGAHQVDEGNLVQVAQTMLATTESINPIYVEFYLSESELIRFRQLKDDKSAQADSALDHKTEQAVQMGIGEGDEYPYTGEINFSAFGVDPDTGTNLVRAIFPNPNRKLVPGLFVRIKIPIGEPQKELLVENRAILTDQRGDYVLVVNDKNVVEYRPVELGRLDHGLRVIQEGLQPDDLVIINGLQSARPEAKVDPQVTEMKTLETGAPTAFIFGAPNTRMAVNRATQEEQVEEEYSGSSPIGFPDPAVKEVGATAGESSKVANRTAAASSQPPTPAEKE